MMEFYANPGNLLNLRFDDSSLTFDSSGIKSVHYDKLKLAKTPTFNKYLNSKPAAIESQPAAIESQPSAIESPPALDDNDEVHETPNSNTASYKTRIQLRSSI
eukprot:scaffold33223_cov38-Cyclotella_meneghiniana.AAC.5